MVKAVLFDFDGVLTLDATGSQSICNYICKETGLNKDLFKKEYRKYNNALLYGKATHEDIWEELCAAINKDVTMKILYNSFINTPLNNDMLLLVKELKSKNYKTGMVTDNKKDRMNSIVEYHNLDKYIDTIIVSADIGSGKEEVKIFLETMKSLNVTAEECIFIDNQEKNLIVPKELGMNVIYYSHEEKNTLKLVKELRGLGVEI